MTSAQGTTSFKTLVYSPDVQIYIENTDVSADIVRGSINRITGGASSLTFTLSNKDLRYNNKFRRMDRVQVYLKRIAPVLVFTGYLDLVPGLQIYPSTVTFKASDTLKRILYMYWDTGLAESMKLLNQQITPFGGNASGQGTATDSAAAAGDASGSQTQAGGDAAATTTPPAATNTPPAPTTPNTGTSAPGDGNSGKVSATSADPNDPNNPLNPLNQDDAGIGNMLIQILIKVGGWDNDQIHVQEFPKSFLGYLKDQLPNIKDLSSNAEQAFKTLFQWDAGSSTGSGDGAGGGSLGDATFSSIGPPANGKAYNDDEIVWIVKNAGWTGEDVVIGASIVKAESGGNPAAVNAANNDGSVDRGLWQINSVHDGMLPGQNRFDPAVSTRLAREVYKGSGWQAWSTYSYHGTAQQYYGQMRAAAAKGGTPPPKSSGGSSSSTASGGKPATTPTPSTPATAPGTAVSSPAKPAALGSYGLPTGTNINYGAPGFPTWCYELGKKFNVKPSTYAGHQESDRREAGYTPNPQHLNRGIDWSGSVGDLQKFAEYLLGIAPNTPALEQIIWMNPSTGKKIGWAGRSPDSSGAYFANDYSGHQDHVHTRQSAALDGSAAMAGAGDSTSGGGTGSTGSDQLAKNIFTYTFNPGQGGYNSAISGLLTGRYASINDEPLIKVVRALTEARMCDFQSAPNGDFIAFYPDYFGIDGTAPVLKLEDVEMKNVAISINDDALTTHVFTQGAVNPNGSLNSGQTELGYMYSPGVVTVEDEWIFKRITEGMYFTPEIKNAAELLGRYGIRPYMQNYPNIYQVGAPQVMLLVAIKLFMQKWAEQYQTSVEFTFMPELFPGMRVELVGHDLIVYVKSVTHNFDFEQGFTTSAQVMAPMSVSRTAQVKAAADIQNTKGGKG